MRWKMVKRVCDLCGKEMMNRTWYEVTERTLLCGNMKIDVCTDCMKEIRRKARERRDSLERESHDKRRIDQNS